MITKPCSETLFKSTFLDETFLYIGSLAAGFAESVLWIPIGICFVFFAKKYHVYSEKSLEDCIMMFSGYMLISYQASEVTVVIV